MRPGPLRAGDVQDSALGDLANSPTYISSDESGFVGIVADSSRQPSANFAEAVGTGSEATISVNIFSHYMLKDLCRRANDNQLEATLTEKDR